MQTIQGYPVDILYIRKKNSSAHIRDGRVILRVSSRLGANDRKRHVDSLLAQVSKRLLRQTDRDELYPLALSDGQIIRVLGERCMVHVEVKADRKHPGLKIRGQAIHLIVPSLPQDQDEQHQVMRTFRQLMARKKADWLFDYMSGLNAATVKSKKLKRTSFREQLTRWGSCSQNGTINISSRLIFCPPRLLEYVCIHELCHLIQANHSDKFWELVKLYLPDMKERQKALRLYL